MADLEDFFAKRDKKKKKAPKFEAEDVAKILEKKRVDMGKSSYQPVTSEGTEPVSEYKAQDDDDEWREAVESTPDYTGLKIQELVLEDNEEEEKDGTVDEENHREGPWRGRAPQPTAQGTESPVVVIQTPSAAAAEEPKQDAVEKEEAVEDDDSKSEKSSASDSTKGEADKGEADAPVAKKGAYVPPSVRKAQEAAAAAAAAAAMNKPPAPVTPLSTEPKPDVAPSGKYVPPSKRLGGTPSFAPVRPKKATAVPSFNDEELFPSLGS